MEYKEYKPNKILYGYIECYWSAYSEKPPFRETESLIPDGTIELMFNFGDDYSKIIDGNKSIIKGSHIIGIRKHSLTISQTSKQDFFCVRFKPGGSYPFFKIPVHLFANNFYGINELFGNQLNELEEQLYETKNNFKRVEIANKFFTKKLNYALFDYKFVDEASRILLQNSSESIENVAYQFNTNYKTIERRFSNVLGLTPTEYLKIKRFNNSVLLMYSCRYNSLTDIGYQCGYYDQSHFIREFKRLTGFTPKEFLKNQFTIVQIIQPALALRMSKSYNFHE